MKLFFRTPWVQSMAAWLLSLYLGATLATMRWSFENRGPADDAVASPRGVIGCFWHGRIALAVVCRRVLRDKPRRVLISPSPDGEFITKVVGRLDFPALRGTSALTDRRRMRKGAAAFRGALRFLEEGGVIAITPDGPRGPAQEMPMGPVLLARMRETPVFLFGLAAEPALTLKSWDRARIPLPFGRGCVVFEGPLLVSRDADDAALEATRAEWQDRLNAAQARAEAVVTRG
ncbi:MAG TPA: lysophospholipid acyltransferase family protein [Caulobacteraceae bacterium]|nr:lysophospholipid acyltransferase family protein [Caulobacteraceae bacterium]